MKPELVYASIGGKVQSLRYKHRNEKVGCAYELETNTMIQAEMRPLRADGSVVEMRR